MQAAVAVGALHERYRPPVGYLEKCDPDNAISPASSLEAAARTAALDKLRIQQARESFQHFVEYAITDDQIGEPLVVQWYQDEWSAAMDNEKRLLVIAPRYHGKTSIIVARAVWELGRNPNLRIKIVCSSDGKAMDRLFEVKQLIEDNDRVRKVFPNLVPADEGSWTKHKLIVRRTALSRDASIEALGITSTATGGRADLLIADDVVDRRNALTMPALREQIKQAWKSDWTQLLDPESRIWYIYTLWHKDDLSHELIENEAYAVVSYSVDENFGSLWPAKWSEAALRERFVEIQSIEFNRAFRNIAQDESITPVKQHWLQFKPVSEFPPIEQLHFLTSYDTAKGLKESNDFTAEVVIAVHRESKSIYVVDASHDRQTLAQQASWVFNSYTRYNPFKIRIEDVGLAGLYSWVVEQYPDLEGITDPVVPGSNKYQRLVDVTPYLERGQVVFASHLNPHGSDYIPGRGNLIGELTDFPIGKHDDMVDAFSQALDGARRYLLDRWAEAGEDKNQIKVEAIRSKGPKIYEESPDEDTEGQGPVYYTSGGRPRRRPPSTK